MNEVERYLFDLQGYLILEDVLTQDQVAELNRLVDVQNLPEPGLESNKARFGKFLTWGQPFCDLLDHSRLMPYLKVILGDGFRLDHYYGIYLREGTGPLPLHGGNTPYDPPEYYHFRNGQMYNGLTVVAWNLTDTGPAHGGFCCIPGSHKANYALPQEIREAHYQAGCVVIPEARAGSLVIFTEALTHGTTPWWGKHQRRSLLYKYSPGQQSWAKTHIQPPPDVELTPRQRLLFEPPYFYPRASLFAEGG
ncbi:MAG: mitomycin antibiotics/polyketide fumonisin biosynthesis protein [Chloroflexi bacterium]|nr:MAG: mitomycin antibiotics/polyketide fumonisin biosynthesis protein [Chloroflexota bacterium]